MTLAIIPRRDGDAFQARQFWYYASDMLRSNAIVLRVGFEAGPRGFDDFWVEYVPGRGPGDAHGDEVRRDHVQCKWHTSHGHYGYNNLTQPEFINAEKVSLLQRAVAAQREHAPEGSGARFRLLSNWRPQANDALAKLVNTRTSGLRLDALAAGKTDRSEMGKLRKAWREHLELDDDALRLLARTLAFSVAPGSPEEQRMILNDRFAVVGLAAVPLSTSTLPHDDLVFQWASQGTQEFDAARLRDICRRESLLANPVPRAAAYGVKSFEHPIDPIDERCEKVLNLLPAFNERFLKNDREWGELYPELRNFLVGAARESEHLRLVLDTHASLAFAAGSVLNTKSGKTVELEQRTNGRHVWTTVAPTGSGTRPSLRVEREVLPANGPDIVVAVGLTHVIAERVRKHATQHLSSAGLLLSCTVDGRSGQSTVEDGAHAAQLADELSRAIASARDGRSCTVHLFIAAPNAFTFMAGQRQAGMGRATLYEYDFENARGETYESSLTLPLAAVANEPARASDV